MSVLYATHPRYLDHVAGRGHPESPARLRAVSMGIGWAGLDEALVPVEPRPATGDELDRIHPAAYRRALRSFCEAGGGQLDGDTAVVEEFFSLFDQITPSGVNLVLPNT